MQLSRDQLRLLIVEDEELDFELLQTALRREGFSQPMKHLTNGEIVFEFFKYLKATGAPLPHLVIMDINMPLIDGVRALKRLREHPASRDLPVIILSSDQDPGTRHELEQLGIFRFIGKSADCSQVVAALDDFLDGPAPLEAAPAHATKP